MRSSWQLSRSIRPRLILPVALLAVLLLASAPANAQSGADEIDDKVAAALYDRGMVLFEQGDVANAKKMFVECLERSPNGSRAADALRMLRSSNEKLGIADLDQGRPADNASDPLDPYSSGGENGDQPIDPYEVADGSDPLDPYAEDGLPPNGEPGTATDQPPREAGRKGLMLWSGLYGFELGLALGGPLDDDDNVSGGAVLLGVLGAGAGVGLSYWLSNRYSLSAGQSVAIASAGTWGAYNIGLLGDIFTGDDSDPNDVHKYIAFGGLAGIGSGIWYAAKQDPSEGDVAFVNSLSMLGTSAGLLLGVAMDPPRSEAYSLNAFIGSMAGIGTGLFLADGIETTRRRMFMVDIGAAAGTAATWVLLYPLMSDDATNNDEQVAGLLSTLTMVGGAGLAWYLTRGSDEPQESVHPGDTDVDVEAPAPPAFMQRSSGGRWNLGTPMVRPMDLPTLAPREGHSLGLDLLSGRF